MILVSFYALFSAIAVLVPLIHFHWVTAFSIAVLSAASYAAGEELRDVFRDRRFTHKLGRLIAAGLLIALALYLSDHRIALVITQLPGTFWAAIGLLVGILSHSRLLRR